MFYEPKNDDHGLPFNPFKACVVPRPIGWVTTLSHDGILNLAPFSISNQLAYDPPFVFFSGSGAIDEEGAAPRVKESPVNLECRHHATITLPSRIPKSVHHVVIGEVDWLKIQPLARMGYMDYTYVNHVFTMPGPKGEEFRPGQIGEHVDSGHWDRIREWDRFKEKA